MSKNIPVFDFFLEILFFLPSKLHTQRFFGFWETHKVPGSMVSTEPPCTCLSCCFPCNTWRNVSHSKQGKAFLIKNERSTKTSVCGRKKKRENIFSDSQWCLCFGYGAENKICSIKETQAFCFILFKSLFCPKWPKREKSRFFTIFFHFFVFWGGFWVVFRPTGPL